MNEKVSRGLSERSITANSLAIPVQRSEGKAQDDSNSNNALLALILEKITSIETRLDTLSLTMGEIREDSKFVMVRDSPGGDGGKL